MRTHLRQALGWVSGKIRTWGLWVSSPLLILLPSNNSTFLHAPFEHIWRKQTLSWQWRKIMGAIWKYSNFSRDECYAPGNMKVKPQGKGYCGTYISVIKKNCKCDLRKSWEQRGILWQENTTAVIWASYALQNVKKKSSSKYTGSTNPITNWKRAVGVYELKIVLRRS